MGKISNLTNIFQMGWNHQLVIFLEWWIQTWCKSMGKFEGLSLKIVQWLGQSLGRWNMMTCEQSTAELTVQSHRGNPKTLMEWCKSLKWMIIWQVDLARKMLSKKWCWKKKGNQLNINWCWKNPPKNKLRSRRSCFPFFGCVGNFQCSAAPSFTTVEICTDSTHLRSFCLKSKNSALRNCIQRSEEL